jgi:hypothetical protein
VTIIDRGAPPVISLTVAAETVLERTGHVDLRIQRAGTLGSAVSVNYSTVDGSAQAGVDYVATSGTASFAPGHASAVVRVPLLVDPVTASSRTFSFALSDPGGGASLGAPASTLVTIVDDLSPATYTFTRSTYNAVRTGPGMIVAIQRLGDVSAAGLVQFSTSNGSAVAGVDYVATAGTVNFAAGESLRAVVIPLIPTATGGEKTFIVVLSSPPPGSILGQPNAALATILPLELDFPVVFKGHRGGW